MLYWLIKLVAIPTLRLIYRPKVEGLENIPDEGAAILASNHLSFLDSIFLPLMVPRRITFLAKDEFFTEKGVKGFFKKMFFVGVGQVPIDRSGGDSARAVVDTGCRILAQGKLLGIYPEGTRSPDGRLYRGKTGPARMAIEAGVPIIPLAMYGTADVLPAGSSRPRIGPRVHIKIGAPLDFSRYAGMADDRFVLRSMTDEVMYRLMELSGQEYVDIYAAKAKDQLSKARAEARSKAEEGDRLPVDSGRAVG